MSALERVETDALRDFVPRHPYFVGVDSDGCAMDAMDRKHVAAFAPAFVSAYGLEPVADLATETWAFVNLRSTTRGLNRFLALLRTLELLRGRPDVRAAGVDLPAPDALRAFASSGLPLSDAGLERFAARHPDPAAALALAWSRDVNARVGDVVGTLAPFDGVRDALAAASAVADCMVVSAANGASLREEWAAHDLTRYISLVAGQEHGPKADQLREATVGRYAPGHVLMVGDAPGDRDAAALAGALFFPIRPGREVESWRVFADEALPRFVAGTYDGAFQQDQLDLFADVLPADAPWDASTDTKE
ncbi:hypothetical protein [Miniimonas arenae]|uniref:hypothetical protein n=1 Tax=Miniimonas arenae TaxID=676201 RepID=UPI0028AE84DC|nr:hypothetical protein [Miniimonas arenae]